MASVSRFVLDAAAVTAVVRTVVTVVDPHCSQSDDHLAMYVSVTLQVDCVSDLLEGVGRRDRNVESSARHHRGDALQGPW